MYEDILGKHVKNEKTLKTKSSEPSDLPELDLSDLMLDEDEDEEKDVWKNCDYDLGIVEEECEECKEKECEDNCSNFKPFKTSQKIPVLRAYDRILIHKGNG
jgi:hypothetical protein